MEDSSKQQNETLFSNSPQLLFKEKDIIANSVGLKELVKLKQERKINSERIDLITSYGLKIVGAKLQGANLQWLILKSAHPRKVDLQAANLQTTNLKDTKFEYSLYDENTQFPDGFDPKQHGMRESKLT